MTDEYVPPKGPRFSQLYIARSLPLEDSKRLRVRIAAFFERKFTETWIAKDVIEMQIGAEIGYVGGAYDIAKFLRECPMRDFLDFITCYGKALEENGRQSGYHSKRGQGEAWFRECRAAFIEENVAFLIDDAGIVRPLVDAEFSRNLSSLLSGLADPRLAAVRNEVEAAIHELEKPKPNTKNAIRSIFEAIEIYIKLAVTSYRVERLDAGVILDHVLPIIQKKPGMFSPSKEVAANLANSIVDWIKGAHFYRHGQGVTEPAPPPFDLSVAYVSTGAGYLRWLVENTIHTLPD